MRSLVTDLENDITNNKDILSILNKALIISKDLCLNDFENWIECEINGYDSIENLPKYRFIECQIFYSLPYRKINNLAAHPKIGDILKDIPKEYYDFLVKVAITSPISDIVNFIGKKDDYRVSLNKSCENIIKNHIPDLIRIYHQCALYKIESIIDRIKPEILRWCAELKKNNIYGHDNQFTSDEINNAKTINYNLLIINNPHIQFNDKYYDINNQNTVKNYISDNLEIIETIINENDVDDDDAKIKIINNIKCVKEELDKKELDLSKLEKAMLIIKDITENVISNEISALLLPYIMHTLSLIFTYHTAFLQGLLH